MLVDERCGRFGYIVSVDSTDDCAIPCTANTNAHDGRADGTGLANGTKRT